MYYVYMNRNITITLNQQEKDRLSRLALSYGLSLPDFSHKVLTELNETFPTESFKDYKNPKLAERAFNRALNNLKAGRVKTGI